MVRADAARGWGEAESNTYVEWLQCRHEGVKPLLCTRLVALGPAQPRAHIADPETFEPAYRELKSTLVLEVEPLAEPQLGREGIQRPPGCTVVAQQAEVEMAPVELPSAAL